MTLLTTCFHGPITSATYAEDILGNRCTKDIRPHIPKSTALQIHNALIQPHFDYCAAVWDVLSSYLSEKLQNLQNRAAKLISQVNCEVNSNPLLQALKWNQLPSRRCQITAMMFTSLNGLAPVYLRELFRFLSKTQTMTCVILSVNQTDPPSLRGSSYSGSSVNGGTLYLKELWRSCKSIGQFQKKGSGALGSCIRFSLGKFLS